MSICLRRREFIAGLGGTVVLPVLARAHQGERMRRIGVLMPDDENNPEPKRRVSAFTQALAGLGWTDGRNVQMDLRWHDDDTSRIRALAQELVGTPPDTISLFEGAIPCAKSVYPLSFRSSHCRPLRASRDALRPGARAPLPTLCVFLARQFKRH